MYMRRRIRWLLLFMFLNIGVLMIFTRRYSITITISPRKRTVNVQSAFISTDRENIKISHKSGKRLPPKPNIVFILADDYGWRDIGYHGSEIRTPHMDKLAAEGVKLENYYVLATCSPSRASILSGRYSSHTTINRMMVPSDPCALRNLVTIPEMLRDNGYTTHLVGKWHVGMETPDCYPNSQGFDTFFGFLGSGGDYFTHEQNGHVDFWENSTVTNAYRGRYSTHIFAEKSVEILKSYSQRKEPIFLYLPFQAVHMPRQAPDEYLTQYESAEFNSMSEKRKVLAAMTSCMDEAVHNVTEALRKYGMWDNTVIIFSSDNGGAKAAEADNGNQKGYKSSYFEGGIHVTGFVAGQILPAVVRGRHFRGLMGAADWLPTIVEGVAGLPMDGLTTDGYNMWDSIRYGSKSPRTEYIYAVGGNCDWSLQSPIEDRWMYGTIKMSQWKLMLGPPWQVERIIPPQFDIYDGNQYNEKNLHDIEKDPGEKVNLFDERPDIVAQLMDRLREHCRNALPPIMVGEHYCQGERKSHKHMNVCTQSAWLREIYANSTR